MKVVGRLFHEFSITLAVTIVISAVVSLTLVRMMCAKLIRHHSEAERSSFSCTLNARLMPSSRFTAVLLIGCWTGSR